MKRFIAFSGSRYYPSGGWKDLSGNEGFDTLEQAKDFFLNRKGDWDDDWIQIVDTQTWKIIFQTS